MLRDAGAHYGLGCGGAPVADVLAKHQEPVPVTLTDRLARPRQPIQGVIGNRKVGLHAGMAFSQNNPVAVPLRLGNETCLLHASSELIDWLQQPFGLDGSLLDEEPPQQALLLELACVDLLKLIETHVGEDIRFGERGDNQPSQSLVAAFEADGRMLPLRLELTERLAEAAADFLDRLQPPKPADVSGHEVEMVIEAGWQDLSINELESLMPGDIVMLASHRTVAVADGKLVAPVRRQADGVELDGPFYPRGARAAVGSLADIHSGANGAHMIHMTAEAARIRMTLAAIDGLKQRHALPLSYFDETGVDLVVDNRRFGRAELVMIGAGMGARIVSIFPNAAGSRIS